MKRFIFTITDLGLFIGKSPVTIRGWERDGFISLPRDSGGDRKLTTTDIREVTQVTYDRGRIRMLRYNLVLMVLTAIEIIEAANVKEKK